MPTEYYELSDPGVKTASTVSTVLTCILVAFSTKLAAKTKTAFDVCTVLMVLPILISDFSYWLTIAKVVPVPMNEPPRTMSLVLTCGLACALCCHRFRVFARAGLADWYTPRRSRLLVGFILLHTFTSMCVMSTSYWLQREYYSTGYPSSPFRKATQLAQFGVNMPLHLAFTFMTFRIVWDIRAAVIRRKSVQNTLAGSGGKGSSAANADYNGRVTLTVPDMLIRESSMGTSESEQTPTVPVVSGMKRKSVLLVESGTLEPHIGNDINIGASPSPSPSFYRAIHAGSKTNLIEGTLSLSKIKSTLKAARQHTLPRADKEFYWQASKVLVSIAVMVVSALSASLSFVLIFSILVDATAGSLVRMYLLAGLYQWHHIIALVK